MVYVENKRVYAVERKSGWPGNVEMEFIHQVRGSALWLAYAAMQLITLFLLNNEEHVVLKKIVYINYNFTRML